MKEKKSLRLKRFLKFVEENKKNKNIHSEQFKGYSPCADSTSKFLIERMYILLSNKNKKLYQYFFMNRFTDKKYRWVRYKVFGYKTVYKDINIFLSKNAIKYNKKRIGLWHSFGFKQDYSANDVIISIGDKGKRSGDLVDMAKVRRKINGEKKKRSDATKKRMNDGKNAWNIFTNKFEEELELEYIPRQKRFVRKPDGSSSMVDSDKVRIRKLYMKNFSSKPVTFKKYCHYIIDEVWGEASDKLRRMDTVIGFMENNRYITNFKITLKMKKKSAKLKNNKIAGKKYSNKIDKRWAD